MFAIITLAILGSGFYDLHHKVCSPVTASLSPDLPLGIRYAVRFAAQAINLEANDPLMPPVSENGVLNVEPGEGWDLRVRTDDDRCLTRAVLTIPPSTDVGVARRVIEPILREILRIEPYQRAMPRRPPQYCQTP